MVRLSRSKLVGGRAAAAWRPMVVLGAMLLATIAAPLYAAAQECVDCVRYAGAELNLRQDPSLEGAVLRFVPKGSEVQLGGAAEQNGYAPVTYDSVPGWVIALALVPTVEEVETFVVPDAGLAPPAAQAPEAAQAPAAQAPAAEQVDGSGGASDETRLTLSALLLRSGPASDAEPILTMPEGAAVILTREGAESGYVTVDYDGVTGWAYADLLAEPGEV